MAFMEMEWKCESCIHKESLDNNTEICERDCKQIFNRTGNKNSVFQEFIEKPEHCSQCIYIKKFKEYWVCSVYSWNEDEYTKFYTPIRINYLNSRPPKWCKLK